MKGGTRAKPWSTGIETTLPRAAAFTRRAGLLLATAALAALSLARCAPAPATTPSSARQAAAPAAAAPGAPAVGGVGAAATAASEPPLKLTVVWTAPGSGQTGLYVAQEAGLWRDQGLDVDLRHIAGTSVVISAMMAGEVQLATPDPASVVQANLGGADVVMIAGLSNNLPFSIISQPSIQAPEALRGKSMGISRFGASTHTAARVALRQWGLAPDQDVVWRQLGDMPSILAALESGQVDAGAISPPTSTRAKQAGLNELIDLGKTGPEFPTSAIGGPRGWIESNKAAVMRFLRGYALAVRRFKADKPYTLEVYRKYLETDDPGLLDEVYTLATDTVSTVPYVSADGYARLIEELSVDTPAVRERDTSAWLDMRYVRELETSGLFAQGAAR